MRRPKDKLIAGLDLDRKSTRLNSSHVSISYAVFCLKKKKNKKIIGTAEVARAWAGCRDPTATWPLQHSLGSDHEPGECVMRQHATHSTLPSHTLTEP